MATINIPCTPEDGWLIGNYGVGVGVIKNNFLRVAASSSSNATEERTYLFFDTGNFLGSGVTVSSVILWMYCSSVLDDFISALQGNVDPSDEFIGTTLDVGDFGVLQGSGDWVINQFFGSTGWNSFDLGAGEVNKVGVTGAEIYAVSTSSTSSVMVFHSSRNASKNRPYLQVTYTGTAVIEHGKWRPPTQRPIRQKIKVVGV